MVQVPTGAHWVQWDAYQGSLVLLLSSTTAIYSKLCSLHADGKLLVRGHLVMSVEIVHCLYYHGPRWILDQLNTPRLTDYLELVCGERGVATSSNPLKAFQFWTSVAALDDDGTGAAGAAMSTGRDDGNGNDKGLKRG